MTEPHSRALCLRVAAQSGLSVTHHRIDFYGRCPECREEPAASRPAARREPPGLPGADERSRGRTPNRHSQ